MERHHKNRHRHHRHQAPHQHSTELVLHTVPLATQIPQPVESPHEYDLNEIYVKRDLFYLKYFIYVSGFVTAYDIISAGGNVNSGRSIIREFIVAEVPVNNMTECHCIILLNRPVTKNECSVQFIQAHSVDSVITHQQLAEFNALLVYNKIFCYKTANGGLIGRGISSPRIVTSDCQGVTHLNI